MFFKLLFLIRFLQSNKKKSEIHKNKIKSSKRNLKKSYLTYFNLNHLKKQIKLEKKNYFNKSKTFLLLMFKLFIFYCVKTTVN
jgi:hypothetical protein